MTQGVCVTHILDLSEASRISSSLSLSSKSWSSCKSTADQLHCWHDRACIFFGNYTLMKHTGALARAGWGSDLSVFSRPRLRIKICIREACAMLVQSLLEISIPHYKNAREHVNQRSHFSRYHSVSLPHGNEMGLRAPRASQCSQCCCIALHLHAKIAPLVKDSRWGSGFQGHHHTRRPWRARRLTSGARGVRLPVCTRFISNAVCLAASG